MVKRRLWGVLSLMLVCLAVSATQADSAQLGRHAQGGVLPNSPDYDWWYGCSPTSAGMMMGYYDIHGYQGLGYSHLVPGGAAELSTYGAPGARANQTIASTGHVTDFYQSGYLGSGDDLPSGRNFDCLADFMGTSQDAVGNGNGSTTFYYWTDGAPFTAADAFTYGVWGSDGMYGMKEYMNHAGYDVKQLYTQLTDNAGATYGFSFEDYKDKIDAGRVVMIQVESHSMFGYGYDEATRQIILHDTWSEGEHSMPWGSEYSGLGLWGVVVMEPTGGEVPLPAAGLLGLLGLGLAGLRLRRFA